MSRGGGRGGKRVRAQIRAKGEDEDGRPLTLAQPKPEDFQAPPLYPPLPSTPQPLSSHSPLTSRYLDTARLLFDMSTYSGYRLSVAERESVRLERYSDRYRRRPGQRTFLDECPQPSLFLFPAELQRWDKGGGRGVAAGGSSKWMFMSTEAMQSHLDRLTVVRDEAAAIDGTGPLTMDGALKEERKDGTAGVEGGLAAAAEEEEKDEDGRKRRGVGDDDDDDDAENEEEREDDEDDDMGGGDYTDRYQEDDDGEGDDVFGDDDGDVF